jgi:hypothetical protein
VGPGAEWIGREPVAVERLDALIERHAIDRLDLVKVDVEGHEPQVLDGMGTYLRRWRPTLLIEVLTDAAGAALENRLEGLGYLYFDIDEVGPPRQTSHIRKSAHWNYLICQPMIAELLGLRSAGRGILGRE